MNKFNIVGYYKKLSIPKKASVWYFVSNVLQKGISFFVVPFYIRYLSSSEYGYVQIFFSWQSIFLIFATLNLFCGVYTKAMVDYEEDRDRYTSSMQGLITVLSVFWFFIYLLLGNKWEYFFEIDDKTTYLLFLNFITSPAVSFWSVRQRVENKYHQMVSLTLLKSIVTPLSCILILLYTDLRALGMIWCFLIVDTLFGLFFYISQFIKGKCFFDQYYWTHALKYNIPLIPHYLSLIALSQVDRILIGNICGKDKAGVYSLAAQISVIMSLFTSAINGSLVPWLYEQYKVRNFNDVKKNSNELCIMMGAMTFMVMLIAPEFVSIIGTDEYKDALWAIPPIVLGTYLSFCYGLFVNIAFYFSRTKYVAFATSIGACMSVMLNYFLLPIFGFISAGYTSLLCYLAFLLMHYFFMVKICKEELGRRNFYDVKFIWLSCLILFVLMLIILAFYNISFVFRYIALLAIIMLFLKNRVKIINQLIVSKKC